MLSLNKIKIIQLLDKKKYRQKYNLFAVEGIKNIKEFLNSHFEIENIYTTSDFSILKKYNYELVTYNELKKISFLRTPQDALALIKIPKQTNCVQNTKGITLVLDNLQDPGNMGTLIRLADWFGVSQIICNKDTVDVYNPKVVQAAMGSLARVTVFYTHLDTFLQKQKIPILATDMNGVNIYEYPFPENAFLILGNEGNGISEKIKHLCTETLTIPRFGNLQQTESLNVAVSGGIILSEFFSQKFK